MDVQAVDVVTYPGAPPREEHSMPPRRQTYREIADDLIARIRAGEYARPDDPDNDGRIPSYREVADLYGVHESTAGRAIALLTDRGWIENSPGRGNFVRDDHPE
jgi:DNA-binding GntR family transcriptional regulator